MKIRHLLCLFLAVLFPLRDLHAMEEQAGLEVRARDEAGELEFDPATGVITARTGVIVTYRDVVMEADRISVDQQTGDVFAEGNVAIKFEGRLWTGGRVYYNFKTRQIATDEFRTGYPPVFVAGEGLTGDQFSRIYTASNAIVTTDNYAHPNHRIRARRITLIPDDYVEAWHATLFLGEVPVFYFPYYRRNIGPNANNWTFTPGYRRLYGPYLLSTYNWYWNERLSGALHLDYRERRGPAFGPDFNYRLGRFGDGSIQHYYAHDFEPGEDLFGRPVPTDRQRLAFSHRATLRPNLTARAAVNYQTDPTIVRDFFEGEYRKNVQPNTFFETTQLWPNFVLDLYVQPRINDFFETVERLPEVRLTGLRQQLGATPFYYDGESSFGHYQRKFAYDLEPRFAATRGDSFHQVVLPQTFFGWLNVTPRVGGRYTYYTEAHGPGGITDEQHRGVFNTGMEVSTKASRVWGGARNRLWDINELRHIVEPSVNYSFVPSPTRRPPELPQFDHEVPSLRLLPLEFPDYNAIDAIDSQNVLRFMVRNRLQTKRTVGVQNVVNWAVYTDWRLDPRPDQGTFSDIFSDLGIRPRSWITLTSNTRYDINDTRWTEANHRIVLHPHHVWSLMLGHRYLDDPNLRDPFDPTRAALGNNTITSGFYYRFNENWAARISHHFEARDGVMEEQMYTIYRDLRSWTSALTLRLRENRVGRNDITVAITFSLKAFPRFGLGDDSHRPSVLVGG